jgi:hypothetical protein
MFKVRGIMPNGTQILDGTMNFVPRVGEEIDANGYIYVVENVRYIFRQGQQFGQPVMLTLRCTSAPSQFDR